MVEREASRVSQGDDAACRPSPTGEATTTAAIPESPSPQPPASFALLTLLSLQRSQGPRSSRGTDANPSIPGSAAAAAAPAAPSGAVGACMMRSSARRLRRQPSGQTPTPCGRANPNVRPPVCLWMGWMSSMERGRGAVRARPATTSAAGAMPDAGGGIWRHGVRGERRSRADGLDSHQ